MTDGKDLLSLSIEEFIIRATKRYVTLRNELTKIPAGEHTSHLRHMGEHKANIEKLLGLKRRLANDRQPATATAVGHEHVSW